MVWNYHDEDLAVSATQVELDLKNIPAKKATLHHYCIDARHSNSYEVWKAMGSSQSPTEKRIKKPETTGQFEQLDTPRKVKISDGNNIQSFELPPQGVSLLVFT